MHTIDGISIWIHASYLDGIERKKNRTIFCLHRESVVWIGSSPREKLFAFVLESDLEFNWMQDVINAFFPSSFKSFNFNFFLVLFLFCCWVLLFLNFNQFSFIAWIVMMKRFKANHYWNSTYALGTRFFLYIEASRVICTSIENISVDLLSNKNKILIWFGGAFGCSLKLYRQIIKVNSFGNFVRWWREKNAAISNRRKQREYTVIHFPVLSVSVLRGRIKNLRRLLLLTLIVIVWVCVCVSVYFSLWNPANVDYNRRWL